MTNRWAPTILFGLLTLWTGLLRSIEARAFKPNAFWFCLTLGLAAIAAGFLYRLGRSRSAATLATAAAAIVLGFYAYCFVCKPQDDATIRVGVIILGSICELIVIFLPAAPHAGKSLS